MILDIVFVRHGLSCANTLAKAKYGMHLLYPDPELAQKGVEMSKLLSSTLIKNIKSRWNNEPYSIGSSQMIRAQETAYYMISSALGKPINVMPHIGESGFSSDNYSLSIEKQHEILKKRDPEIIESLKKGKDGREIQTLWQKANISKFLEWAENNPSYFELGSDGHYRAVIFTHSHFLSHSFKMPKVLGNNDAIHSVIDTTKGDSNLRFEYWVLYRGTSDFLCPDKCRVSVCTKNRGGRRARYTRRRKLVRP